MYGYLNTDLFRGDACAVSCSSCIVAAILRLNNYCAAIPPQICAEFVSICGSAVKHRRMVLEQTVEWWCFEAAA